MESSRLAESQLNCFVVTTIGFGSLVCGKGCSLPRLHPTRQRNPSPSCEKS